MTEHERVRLDSVERAIADIAAGKAVVVVDDEDRENEGDIIFAASRATPELMAFTIRHSSGVICVPMPAAMLDRLEIPLMTPHNKDKLRTAYTISVDARDGVTTGISAADRAHTARVLADSATEPWELTRPGHVFPLRYREGGVLVRRGHTEAAVDLATLAGLTPAGVLVEVVNDDGTMKRAPELRAFADEHGLAMISIEDLVRYRRRHEVLVDRVAETRLPTRHGDFTAYGYRITVDGSEHIALVHGDVASLAANDEPVLVRVHSECLTGDVFGSHRCDCGPQLDEALARIVEEGAGIVVYLRGHEGRGIGLVAKLQAYQLQDGGRDTVDANLDLGLPADARHYGTATQVLRDLGVTNVRLLTNNPDKTTSLEDFGIRVHERVGAHPAPERPQPGLPADQARPDGPRPAPPRPGRGRRPGRRGRPGRPDPRRRARMSGTGAPDQEVVDCADLKVAVVAASWHTQVMDGLLDGARRACADYGVDGPRRRPGPGRVRAAGRGRRPRRRGVRRDRRARRRHPRRHAALRLRVQRRHRRPDEGRRGPPGAGRLRAAHLRHRRAGARPRRPRGLARGQGLRGGVRGVPHRPRGAPASAGSTRPESPPVPAGRTGTAAPTASP